MKRTVWLGIGWSSLGLGAAGIPLPLLPTTPFMLLAAYAFARASPRLHRRLLHHRVFGPPIRAWYRERAISRRAKALALLALAATLALSAVLSVPLWALALQGAVSVAVAVFLISRPSPARHTRVRQPVT